MENATIVHYQGNIRTILQENWHRFDLFVCIMSTGIVVRSIKDLIQSKEVDPGIVVIDESGKHSISLLSGHLGRANEVAETISQIIHNRVVITTASDVIGHTALDIWCRNNSLISSSSKKLTGISAKLIRDGRINIWFDQPHEGELTLDFSEVEVSEQADILVRHRQALQSEKLLLYPKNLYLGVGCNRGTAESDFIASWQQMLSENRLHSQCFCSAASVDVKIDEKGMLQFCRHNVLKLIFYDRASLDGNKGISSSDAVIKAIGIKGVAEPSALAAAGYYDRSSELLVAKQKWTDVTMAVARKRITLQP